MAWTFMAFASLTALAQHALSYSPQIRTKPKQMRDPQVNNPPVAEYVLQRLAVRSKKIARNDCIIPVLLSVPTHPSQQDLGIKKCFGVPGDYAFSINDAVENVDGLDWVGNANELNAAYAADGYARVHGAAILSTTYGVGELSAINGVMGSRAHRLPVFHIVGMPSERIQRLGLPTHHNLGDNNYERFQSISASACCVHAVLTPENAVDELERVIREALRHSGPAYIVMSELSGYAPILSEPIKGCSIREVQRQKSSPYELDAAVESIVKKLNRASKPAAIATSLLRRYGITDLVSDCLTHLNLPFAQTANDKGTLDESLPLYNGMYACDMSSPPAVQEFVEKADLLIEIGCVIKTEFNMGMWSNCDESMDQDNYIGIHHNWVQVGRSVFVNTAIEDVLEGIRKKANPIDDKARIALPKEFLPLVGTGDDPLSSASFYPRLQRELKGGDTLVIETGTCMLHLNKMVLPGGVSAEGQGLWGSIGWATPACLGIEMAKEGNGRTWCVTGDGAHQSTLNDISVMGRYNAKPIIFVLNNGIYGVEDVLSMRGHEYDDLASVNYHMLPEALGCTDWLSTKVNTVEELDTVFDKLRNHDGAAYIEVMIPNEESQPYSKGVIDRAYKLDTPSP